MNAIFPERELERLLEALERDLLEATDEEILAAAHELGMNPAMKGSAAFFGVTVAVRWRSETERAGQHEGALRPPKGRGDVPTSD